MFFTEQRGRLRIVSAGGQLLSAPAWDLTSQTPGGEAGMLGLELDRNFASNHRLYVFHCLWTAGAGSSVACRITRLVESNNSVTVDKILWEMQGTSGHHNAGRIKIGPDNLLYVATGDISEPGRAQDLANPHGKVLRMTLDGAPAPGNPLADSPYTYAYGFRDPQGLAFDASGQLYGTDHGPVSNDEVNIIHAGKNYGWPNCIGRCGNPAYVDPVRLFHPETAAPSGATFYTGSAILQWTGSMFFATLGLADNTFAKHVHRIKFDRPGGTAITEEEALYRGRYGRTRDVVQGPDGYLYFSSSNGNGTDKIIRVRPK